MCRAVLPTSTPSQQPRARVTDGGMSVVTLMHVVDYLSKTAPGGQRYSIIINGEEDDLHGA
jgi:hypothetical protein